MLTKSNQADMVIYCICTRATFQAKCKNISPKELNNLAILECMKCSFSIPGMEKEKLAVIGLISGMEKEHFMHTTRYDCM